MSIYSGLENLYKFHPTLCIICSILYSDVTYGVLLILEAELTFLHLKSNTLKLLIKTIHACILTKLWGLFTTKISVQMCQPFAQPS